MRRREAYSDGFDMPKPSRIARKTAQPMSEVIAEYIRAMKLASGLNTRRVFDAWGEASGASEYTSRMFFRDGRLHVTLTSSVVRNQLSFQKMLIMEKMNQILREDGLFVKDDPSTRYVSEIVLR